MKLELQKIETLMNHHKVHEFLKEFVHYIPDRLDAANGLGLNDSERSLCNRLDYIEFHYRRYLSGVHRTLHRTFYEIKGFFEDDGYPEPLLKMLADIEAIMLQNEYYELMGRLNNSVKKIKKLITKYGIQP